jgi:hypothetical protein
MNLKNQWIWVVLAAGLLGFILVERQVKSPAQAGPVRVVRDLRPGAVTSVQVRPKAQLEVRADRTDDGWRLTEPVNYPAQSANVDNLLKALADLSAAAYITAAELKNQPKADEDYGFTQPQASIIIRQPGKQFQILIGTLTAPGDQVFVQVVGVEAVNVVDAGLLKLIPKSANDWRDTALIRVKNLGFDQLAVTNAGRVIHFQKVAQDWRMTSPIEARADSARVDECLQRLEGLEVGSFVSDDPAADLESYGLQPADLEIGLSQGTNLVALVQFGKSPTNSTGQLYARRFGQKTIVTVPRDPLTLWRGSVKDFREQHLLSGAEGVNLVEVQAAETFSLIQQSSNSWRVMPQDFPADSGLVADLVANLASMQIVEFTKDVVTPIDFTNYGLALPSAKYTLKVSRPDSTNNTLFAELDFGATQNERVFARRSDETSVYAVSSKDFQRLPVKALQLRERQIWNFSENEIARLTIRQQGKVRQIVRKGAHNWALDAGSQGIINDLAIEESVRPLCRLTAAAWVDRGEQSRAKYGLTENTLQLTLELKNGEKRVVSFGSVTPGEGAYAGVTLDGDVWIFEFPASYYRFVNTYLTIPAGVQ